MTPDELRRAIGAYLDKGPDFLKFGGTSHFSEPTFIGFSAEAQQRHRRGGAHAQPGGRDAFDQHRGPARVDRRRHRRHSASRIARRPRDARRPGQDDRRSRVELLDAREHDHRAGVEAPPQEQGRSRKEEGRRKGRTGEGRSASRAREDDVGAAQGSGRRRRRSRDAALERAEADSRRLPCHAGHRQLLGRGARVHADAQAAGAGSRHRDDHGDRRTRRARHDAVAGDRRRRRATARWPRAA